jgi:glycosyltransferase involved in cell wall biosynthesis
MQDKNLLLITHNYRTYVKDPTDIISHYFNQINVCVRHNPIADVSNIIPINYLKLSTKKHRIDLTNKPKNLNVIPTPVFYLPTEKGYKKLGEKHFRVVNKIIQKHNIVFDIIHAHFTWSAGYVGTKLKEKYDRPLVITTHGYGIYDLPYRDEEWKKKIEHVLKSADCIIAVSDSILFLIKKMGVETPVKVIPNGFSNKIFYPQNKEECRKKINLPLDRKIILNVGDLYGKVKGHRYLIEAMVEVVKHRKDVLCIIIGSGKLKNELEAQIKKSCLKDSIKLVGGKAHGEIPIWINACDAFVLPSLNEANPTVMFECLGCGKPFVGTKVGGVPEIITSEDYGLLCEPANPEYLSEKILIALDKDWDNEMIRKYAERFRWPNITKEMLKTYDGLLVQRGNRGVT